MTEIAKPAERPRWASDVSADVITPSSGKQDTGWVQEYPPLQYFNWLGKYTHEWLNYLERNTDASLGGGGPIAGVAINVGVILPTTGITPVDTEGLAATDDLAAINPSNLAEGRICLIHSVNAARVITVKHMSGAITGQINLRLGADIVLDDPKKVLVLVRNGTQWDELFGFLGSDPAPYLSADLDVQTKKITTTTVDGDVIIEPNGTGSLSPLTTGKALGKSAQRWNAFLSGANVAGDISAEADGTRDLGATGTRWRALYTDKVYATDWVHTGYLDCETLGDTLNIGATNASLINIGRTGATIALYGSITEVHTTNTYVTDKLLTLNDGGLATSGDGAGIEIEEGGSATAYIKVSSNRNKWSFKAPNDAAVVSIGSEAAVVGDIGLVSSVLTFMSTGFSFKNSAGTVIASAVDAGGWTFGPSGYAGAHTIRGKNMEAANAFDAALIVTGQGTGTIPGVIRFGFNETTGRGVIRGYRNATAAGGCEFHSGTANVGFHDENGAWTWGPPSNTPYTTYHTVSKSIFAQTSATANDSDGAIRIGANTYHASGAPSRKTGIGGASIGFFPRTTDTANSLIFYNNLAADGDVAAGVNGSVTQVGSWILGAINSYGFHMTPGDCPNQITAVLANCRPSGGADGRSFSTRAGGGILCLAALTNSANCIEFHANQDDDGVDTDADLIGFALPTGAFTFGPSAGADVQHVFFSSKAGTGIGDAFVNLRSTGSASNQKYLQFQHSSTTAAGGIQRNGTGSDWVAFSGSDRRIKKEITPLESQWNKVKSIKLCRYQFKYGGEGIGPIAQELNEIYPEKVNKYDDGAGEDVPKGVQPWEITHGWSYETLSVVQELMGRCENYDSTIRSLQSTVSNLMARLGAC